MAKRTGWIVLLMAFVLGLIVGCDPKSDEPIGGEALERPGGRTDGRDFSGR